MHDRTLKASFKVQPAQEIAITIPVPPTSELVPLQAPLDLLYEDDDLAVVNKPAGLVVHPAAGHAQDTLVNILLHHVRPLAMGFGESRPGIVHRLDRDTSGILVVTKNDLAHRALADQFRKKSVHRIYWAIVYGHLRQPNGTMHSHLARHPRDRKRFASTKNASGKLAITHYKTVQALAAPFTWLQCQLETGRTHQIRVHLSELHHPIVGDHTYGADSRCKHAASRFLPALKALHRVALHACELGFVHPRTQENLAFKVGWPEELQQLTAALGFKNV